MAQITFDIPDAFLPRVINAMKGLYSIPQIPDPEFEVTPQTPIQLAPLVNEFTDAEWAKEKVRRFILQTVTRYEKMEAKRVAEESVLVEDNLIS